MIGQVFRGDKMKEALQVAADRSTIGSVIDLTQPFLVLERQR